jgi:hypothetical protein
VISIACPTDEGETVFRRAAARTRNIGLRTALLGVSDHVRDRTNSYLQLAGRQSLFELGVAPVNGVTPEQLAAVYDRVLVRGNERPLYDRIKASAKFKRCPLCGEREVKTLDHYLSQSDFPELAVFPANLVPSCSDCNKTKLAHIPEDPDEQLFHPYFDNWSTHRILSASVTVDNAVSVRFSISDAPGFPRPDLQRARKHFQLLKLDELYDSKSAVELVESKDSFRRNYQDGAEVLRAELRYIAQSRQRSNINSWRAALYWGLAESNDFCDGGFELFEEQ